MKQSVLYEIAVKEFFIVLSSMVFLATMIKKIGKHLLLPNMIIYLN